MQAMPSVMPLARTASLTSSVMSRMARPPAVRSSVSRWKTFTAASLLLRSDCLGQPPILRVRAPYVTGEPSVAGLAARGRLAGGGAAAAARGTPDHHRALHAPALVPVDRAVHLVGAAVREGDLEGHLGARADVPGLLLDAVPLDLEGVCDGPVVGGLELVGAGLREIDGARAERELLLGDLDRLDDRSALGCGRPAAASVAGGEHKRGK